MRKYYTAIKIYEMELVRFGTIGHSIQKTIEARFALESDLESRVSVCETGIVT